jgi:hypothetical protein
MDNITPNKKIYYRCISNDKLYLRCNNCGQKMNINRDIIKSFDKNQCILNKKIKCCKCGNISDLIINKDPQIKKIQKRNYNIYISIILIIGCLFLIFSIKNITSNNSNDYKSKIWTEATNAVRSELKAPSTASFPCYDNSFVTDNNDGTYTVSSYVDADNSFGAKIRSNWNCTVDSSGNVTNIQIS